MYFWLEGNTETSRHLRVAFVRMRTSDDGSKLVTMTDRFWLGPALWPEDSTVTLRLGAERGYVEGQRSLGPDP